jgi:hypothetical protein
MADKPEEAEPQPGTATAKDPQAGGTAPEMPVQQAAPKPQKAPPPVQDPNGLQAAVKAAKRLFFWLRDEGLIPGDSSNVTLEGFVKDGPDWLITLGYTRKTAFDSMMSGAFGDVTSLHPNVFKEFRVDREGNVEEMKPRPRPGE